MIIFLIYNTLAVCGEVFSLDLQYFYTLIHVSVMNQFVIYDNLTLLYYSQYQLNTLCEICAVMDFIGIAFSKLISKFTMKNGICQMQSK